MRPLRLAGAVLLLALAACGEVATLPLAAGIGPTPTLPAPRATLIPTVHIAPATGWPPGVVPLAAPGTRVAAFASGLDHPRWLLALPNGDVLVAETNAPPKPDDAQGIRGWLMGLVMKRAGAGTPSADRITLLRDADGDGVAELRTVLIAGLHSPFGMALVGGSLYVADTDAVKRFPYAAGDTRIEVPGVVVTPLPAGTINHHWTKNLIASADGRKLYVTVGSNSNVAERGMAAETERAAIWEVDAASGTHRVFASGLRNPNGMAWEPHGAQLWTVVNERDEIGSDLVPDYLTSVRDGAFYGWPYSWYGTHVDERVQPPRPDLVASAVVPDYALGPHTASLGLASSAGSRLPAVFADGMFVGQHGSWNRRPRSGYQVIFVPFMNGRPAGEPLDVLTGFLDGDGNARGRPVGVAIDARGALLVADDVGNTVWRVTAAPLTGAAVLAVLAILLPGCASLPRIVPDLARPSGAPLQIEGKNGPLSPARSKAILDSLASRGEPTDIFARHLALEEALVGSPLTAGNEVVLLRNGPATYEAMFVAIAAARDHVNMETYIFEDDEVGEGFAQLLIERQRAGVQVSLIRDGAGTFGTPLAFFQRMRDAGIRVLEFNPLNPLALRKDWELNQRDHRKLLIVDGRVAFLGGINISSVYSGGSFGNAARRRRDGDLAWRDTDLQLRGPVVAEFQKLFLAAWQNQKGDPLPERAWFPPPEPAGRQVVRAIGSSPDEPFSLIYATLLSAIGSAETSIHLTNAYFVPDPQLLAALEAAAARGVDVRLILPSQTDSWLVFHAGRAHFDRLLRAGVHIHERRGVILHSKTALIDGVWATVGSTNLDWRSFLHNHELNAVVLGADFGAQLQAMFERDLAASDTLTLDAWERRPIGPRLKEWFACAWEYWL